MTEEMNGLFPGQYRKWGASKKAVSHGSTSPASIFMTLPARPVHESSQRRETLNDRFHFKNKRKRKNGKERFAHKKPKQSSR